MDSVLSVILEVSKEEIPLVYKILDKSDKMEEEEFEKSQYALSEYIPPENMLKRIDTSDVGEKYKQKIDELFK